MHFGVALAAKGLKVDWIVGAAIVNLDDVMHLQFHRWAKTLQVVFGAKTMPAVMTAIGRKQRAQILI